MPPPWAGQGKSQSVGFLWPLRDNWGILKANEVIYMIQRAKNSLGIHWWPLEKCLP